MKYSTLYFSFFRLSFWDSCKGLIEVHFAYFLRIRRCLDEFWILCY
uniref:Uncharacterized protein n=1 Tax=Arundo donax TaxID=35708 RepID=A0A0A9ESP6_ARUDO